MSTYQIIYLIISGLTALGTCGATFLALYFWYRDESLKLRFHGMHAYSYGSFQKTEGGYLVFRLINTGYKPISLELAGIKFIGGGEKNDTIIEFSMQGNNLMKDRLPKFIQHGESYIYITTWNSFIQLCKENEYKKINIFVYISSLQKEINFKFDKALIKDLNNSIKG